MKQYYYLLLLVAFLPLAATAQIGLPVTFEEPAGSYTFEAFEGAESQIIANPDMTGENTSGSVMETVKPMGAAFFAGTTVTLDIPIDFSESGVITMQSWSPKADIPVRMKLENADASRIVELDATTTAANQWETLSWNFSASLDPNADYTKVIVFFEFIVDLAGDGSTYYYDNIQIGAPPAVQVGLPLDFELGANAYNFGAFEGAAAQIIANPDMTGANTSGNVMEIVKPMGVPHFAGMTTNLEIPVDFSESGIVTMQTWSPKANIPVRLKIENADASAILEMDAMTTVANAWETLSWDFTEFVDMAASYTKVIVFFEFIPDLLGDGSTYYYDNVQVGGGDGGATIALPVTFELDTADYTFEAFEGAASQIIDNPDMSGENTSASVMETVKGDGSAFFAGTTVELDVPIDFSTTNTITMQTWSPKADIPVRIKIENADASVIAELDAMTTVANAWETLSWDFSGMINPDADYVKVIVFFEFIVDLPGDGSTYYFDNIQLGQGPVGTVIALPVTFELDSADYTFEAFEGAASQIIANPDMSGENTSATVMETVKGDGSAFFAGTTVTLTTPIDFSETNTITMQTWSPKADIPVRIKIENADASVIAELDAMTTVANAWETLSWDFSGMINPAASYTKVIVFFEFIVDLPGDGSTYYFDNIQLDEGPVGAVIELPVTFELDSADYTFEAFEGAASQIIANPDMSGENTSATVMETVKTDGSAFFAGTTVVLTTPIDFSETNIITMQTWSPKADIPVRIKIENADASVIAELDAMTTVANQWETLSWDFSSMLTDGAEYTKVIVFFEFIVDLPGDGSTYYFDNIQLGEVAMGPEIALPLTFELDSADYTFEAFEGAASQIIDNPDMSGANTSNRVMETVKGDGSAFFAGTTVVLDTPIDFSESSVISIQTWSPKADIPVRLKIENADASVIAETDAMTTVASQWETLEWDFSDMLVDGAEYTKVIVFFEFIVDLPGDGTTYYYDNVQVVDPDNVVDFASLNAQVFPNPATEQWTIATENDPIERITLFNLNGQAVLTAQPNVRRFEIPAGNLPSGIYLATVTTAKGQGTVRLVKE